MLYKIVNVPKKVSNKEILIPADTRTRSEYGQKCCIMRKKHTNTKITKIHFFHNPSQWNCLPKDLVDSETVDAFKHCFRDLNSRACIHQ